MPPTLSDAEKKKLLKIARDAITAAIADQPIEKIDLSTQSEQLRTDGASFVTLTIGGKLRGCIGALVANQPLVLDVQEHAVAAALEDFRFPSVSAREIPLIKIEVSWLTPLKELDYNDSTELKSRLRPGVDGVLIKDRGRRATFLPQVWEQISSVDEFLSRLCLKMGASEDLWKHNHLLVFTYQVVEFEEDR